jgi:hypothetical protein
MTGRLRVGSRVRTLALGGALFLMPIASLASGLLVVVGPTLLRVLGQLEGGWYREPTL